MSRAIKQLQTFIGVAFGAVLLATVYWSVVQRDVVNQREDNPRLIRQEQTLDRGTIYDRNGIPIAYSTPDPETEIMQRVYPHPEVASATGYYSYRYGSSGIELAYNEVLRGDDPVQSWWQRQWNIWLNQPQQGYDVQSTIDLHWQQTLHAAFGDVQGAAIMVHIPSGDVLALVSMPDYNPNNIDERLRSLLGKAKNGDARLFNRVQQGLYQPGNVLQLVLLPELLENGYSLDQIVSLDEINLPSHVRALPLACRQLDETITLLTTFQDGCPQPFAAAMDNDLTHADFFDAINTSGFLQPPYYEAVETDHSTGLRPFWINPIPSQAAQAEVIGQGQLLITPLHSAQWLAAIANNGEVPQFRLATHYRAEQGKEWQPFQTQNIQSYVIPQTIEQILPLLQLDENIYGHVGEAWQRNSPSRTSWFNGFVHLPNENGTVLIVVVIEDAPTRDSAAEIGLPILTRLQDQSP